MSYGSTISCQDNKDSRQCWRTPPDLFDTLHQLFHFSIDACATPTNALLPRYWTQEIDCLTQDWTQEIVFCNPPFRNIGNILLKAKTAQQAVFLLPVTALTTRYLDKAIPDQIVIPPYRVKFIPPEGLITKAVSPSLGTVLAIYGHLTPEQETGLRQVGATYRYGV